MLRAGRMALIAASLLFGATASLPQASAQLSAASTDTGVWGDFVDLLVDERRGRLYVSDVSTFHDQGVVVIDLTTRAEISRIPIVQPSGLALSASGSLLAVGTLDGSLHIVDPDRLEVIRSTTIRVGYTVGYVWDVAFYGDERVWVTLAQPPNTAGGTFPAIVIDAATMQEVARFDAGLYGFSGSANVETDTSRGRAYILTRTFGWVYDATQTPPTELAERIYDYNLTSYAVLSPDGTRLFFSSGSVYDAPTFSPIGNTDGTGPVALDVARDAIYYTDGSLLHRRSLSNYSLLSTFGFRGSSVQYEHARSVLIDSTRNVAFVVSGDAVNSETVHAIPLVPAILDPWPSHGSLLAFPPNGISVILSGGLDPASVRIELDGVLVPGGYEPSTLEAFYGSDSPLADGLHLSRVTAAGPSGESFILEWSFEVDSRPPDIFVDRLELVVHTPQATIRGRIADPHLAGAWVDGWPLAVDPLDGSFEVRVNLTQRTSHVVIRAEDTLGHSSSVTVRILYGPEKDPTVFVLVALAGLAGAGAGATAFLLASRIRALRNLGGQGQRSRKPP